LQPRIQPPFAWEEDWSNYGAMSEEPDMATIRDSLKRIMKRKGVKPTTLSLSVGGNRTLVKDLLEKGKDVQIGTLTKLAGALDVSLADLLAAPRVPVAGRIGAGGEIIFEESADDETVARPPGITGALVALVVTGSSMLPKYKDGDIIYIQREHEGLLPDYIGEDCAVRLVSGETYIKQLIRGTTEERFTLLSLNAAPIENVEIEWATPVLFIMPARSRHILS
jgi:phage repressor protein C with HTH and peptisase S24 domain